MTDLEKMKYIYDNSQACPVNGNCDLIDCKPCAEKIWNNAIEEIRADERDRIVKWCKEQSRILKSQADNADNYDSDECFGGYRAFEDMITYLERTKGEHNEQVHN